MNGTQVRIEGVSKTFDTTRVLRDVTLTIEPGEFFTLLGPSGCGKTTLLRMLGGFESPDTGTIYLNNHDMANVPPHRRHVNTIFQNYALFPHMTVFENIAFSCRIRKESDTIIRDKVARQLEITHLTPHAEKYPSQLSGGQKQRVAIARALINEPGLLLLDEPLSALDAQLRAQMLTDLKLIHKSAHITFILVTHDQAEALTVSDRIAIMDQGTILQTGTPEHIYQAPAHPFVAQFIGENNMWTIPVSTKTSSPCITIGESVIPVALLESTHQVLYCVRPEHIHITLDPKLPPSICMPCTVSEIVYAGDHLKVFAQCEIGTLQVHAPTTTPRSTLSLGATWYATWEQNHGIIIPSPAL